MILWRPSFSYIQSSYSYSPSGSLLHGYNFPKTSSAMKGLFFSSQTTRTFQCHFLKSKSCNVESIRLYHDYDGKPTSRTQLKLYNLPHEQNTKLFMSFISNCRQEKKSRHFSTTCSSSSSSSSDIRTWESITSTKNPVVKLFKSLIAKRKARKENNLTVLEGHRLIMDLLSNPNTSSYIQHILVSQQALNHVEMGLKLEDLLHQTSSSIKVNIVNNDILQLCCDTITPQGIVATCTIPKPFSPNQTDITNKAISSLQLPQLFLVLDGVSDPGNVGTLLRSSAAVGLTAVVLLPDCTDVWAPKAIRSSMGASFHVPIISVASLDECFTLLEACGCQTKNSFYAATMDVSNSNNNSFEEGVNDQEEKSSPAYYEIDWVKQLKYPSGIPTNPKEKDDESRYESKVSALCIGKEGSGLSSTVRDAVAKGRIQSVHVPMVENGVVESLNAAVCGSVILFEFSRQKHFFTEQYNKQNDS